MTMTVPISRVAPDDEPDVLAPKSFEELGTSPEVTKVLAARGIMEPFAIQRLVIADAIAGRDILAKSRTGSGKTLGFAVPIVELLAAKDLKPRALILVPTRELAVQVKDEFIAIAKAKGLLVMAAYGGVGLKDQAKAASRAHIIVATPGRLEDLADRRMIDLSKISVLVLDEADRMLDMGFLPQVNKIVRRIPGKRQTMFFSATLDGEVGRLAKAFTTDPVMREVESPLQTVDEMEHRFVPTEQADKLDTLVKLLTEESGRTLVFVRTKRGADRLAYKLKGRGVQAVAMHGDMTQGARERSLERFGSGKVTTLVATDVAARGLDVDNITHVVNYDPPEDHKAYVHRVGRTARAGKSGIGITLVSPAERGDVGRVAARLSLDTEFEKEGMKVLPPRMAYASHRGRKSMMGRRPRRRG